MLRMIMMMTLMVKYMDTKYGITSLYFEYGIALYFYNNL